jgi:hypothetical protein
MDETRIGSDTSRRADVDDVGQPDSAQQRTEPRMRQDETPSERGPVAYEVYEEIFIPLDEGMEPDRRELVAGRVDAQFAKVSGVSAVTQADKAMVTGMSAITMGQKAKIAGFAPLVVTGKKATIRKGAAAVAVAGQRIKLKDHGYVGIALAPKVEVGEGGRVLITPWMAILIGLAFGLGFGVMALMGVWVFRGGMRMLRRRRTFGERMMDRVGGVTHNVGEYTGRARQAVMSRM